MSWDRERRCAKGCARIRGGFTGGVVRTVGANQMEPGCKGVPKRGGV